MIDIRTRPRILAATVAGLLAVAVVRLAWLNGETAAWTVRWFAYWAMLGILGWSGLLVWYWFRGSRVCRPSRSTIGWIAGVIGVWLLLHAHEPHQLKVRYDEDVLLNVSRVMHFEHQAGWTVGARLVDGTLEPLRCMADKRPVMFPALVSLLHTFTGYRTSNPWILNALVSVLLLFAVGALGSLYRGGVGAGAMLLLFAGVPLVAQNATGGGYDLLNVTVIALIALGVAAYFRRPSAVRLERLTVASLVAANVRYESILYVLVPAVAYVAVSVRWRKLAPLGWRLVLAPLGILPALLSNAVLQSNESFLQMSRSDYWSLHNYANNWKHAVHYLFSADQGGTNSLLLAVVGTVAGVSLLPLLRRLAVSGKALSPETAALLLVGSVVFANTVMTLGLGWGEWDDPAASRFTLPLWFLFAWVTMEVVRHLETSWRSPFFMGLAVIACGYFALFALSDSSSARQTNRLQAGVELPWALQLLEEIDPRKRSLVLADSTLPYVNAGYASMPLTWTLRANHHYATVVDFGLYSRAFVVLQEERSLDTGRWQEPENATTVLRHAELKLVESLVVSPFRRVRLMEIISLREDSPIRGAWPLSSPAEERNDRKTRVYDLLR